MRALWRMLRPVCLVLFATICSCDSNTTPADGAIEFKGLQFHVRAADATRLAELIDRAKLQSAFNGGRYCLNRACEGRLSIFVIASPAPSAYTVTLARRDGAYDPHRDAIYLHPSLLESVTTEDWQQCLAVPLSARKCGPTYYLAFLLFHELGHRAIGSRLRVLFHFPGGYSPEQIQEMDADSWGLDRLAHTSFPGSSERRQALIGAVVSSAIMTYFSDEVPLDRISPGHPSMLLRLEQLARDLPPEERREDSAAAVLASLINRTESHRRLVLRAPAGQRIVDATTCKAGVIAVSDVRHLLFVQRDSAETAYARNFLPPPAGNRDPLTWRSQAELNFRDIGSVLQAASGPVEGLRIRCDGNQVVVTGTDAANAAGVTEFGEISPDGFASRSVVPSPACRKSDDLGFLQTSGFISARACKADDMMLDVAVSEGRAGAVRRLQYRAPPGLSFTARSIVAFRSNQLLVQGVARDSWNIVAVSAGKARPDPLVKTQPAFWEACLGKVGLLAIGVESPGLVIAATEYRAIPRARTAKARCGYQEADEVGRSSMQLATLLARSAGVDSANEGRVEDSMIALSDEQCDLVAGARGARSVWTFGQFGGGGVSEPFVDRIDGCNLSVIDAR